MSSCAFPPLEVSTQEANVHRLIEYIRDDFGEAHLYLASHAAFPLTLTPDLLYCIWANFQRDINGQFINIPWIAVADLLFCGLWKEVGAEMYEMDTVTRDILLNRLTETENLGQQRINELSQFLLTYVQPLFESDNPDERDLAQTQAWTARAYTQTPQVAREMTETLTNAYLQQDTYDVLRLYTLIESLEQPLSEFEDLLIYACGMMNFVRGRSEEAKSEFEQLKKKGNRYKIAGGEILIPETTETVKPKSQKIWLNLSILAIMSTGGLYFRPSLLFPNAPSTPDNSSVSTVSLLNSDNKIDERTPPQTTPPVPNNELAPEPQATPVVNESPSSPITSSVGSENDLPTPVPSNEPNIGLEIQATPVVNESPSSPITSSVGSENDLPTPVPSNEPNIGLEIQATPVVNESPSSPITPTRQPIILANDLSAGLLVADSKNQLNYGTKNYRKVQNAIRSLRKGSSDNLQEAAMLAGIELSVLMQLAKWGQNRPGSFDPRFITRRKIQATPVVNESPSSPITSSVGSENDLPTPVPSNEPNIGLEIQATPVVNESPSSPITPTRQPIILANDLSVGLVVADNKNVLNYGTKNYRKVQSAIRSLRKGSSDNLQEAAMLAGIELSVLMQLAKWGQNRPGSFDPRFITRRKIQATPVVNESPSSPITPTRQPIILANDLSVGLVVADNKNVLNYGTKNYRKVQNAIHSLRKGSSDNLQEAAMLAGIELSVLMQLAKWGQDRPGSFDPQFVDAWVQSEEN
jgi:hypothetical protein